MKFTVKLTYIIIKKEGNYFYRGLMHTLEARFYYIYNGFGICTFSLALIPLARIPTRLHSPVKNVFKK